MWQKLAEAVIKALVENPELLRAIINAIIELLDDDEPSS
jgi:hypothetical protein